MKQSPMRGVAPKKPFSEFPYLASPKVDGMRMWVRDGVVLSKTAKPIPNKYVQAMFGHLHGADGEGTVGPMNAQSPEDDVFARSRGPIMSRDQEADFRFWVFDRWDQPEKPATERVPCSNWPGILVGPGIHVIDHQVIRNSAELDAALHNAMRDGLEGLMLRKVNGLYKYGTSTEREGYLLKLKPMATSSAVILCVIEQTHNTNEATTDELGYTKRSSAKAGKVGKGTFGAFLVRDLTTGVEFSIGNGPGLTHEMRDKLWAKRAELPGQYIEYKFQEIGTQDAPRLPQFLRFRPAIDISETEGL